MFSKKCSLCGGKIENGKCTLCGLDVRQSSSSASIEDLLSEDGVFSGSYDFDDEKFDYDSASDSEEDNDDYIYEYSFDSDTSGSSFSDKLENLGSSIKKQIQFNIPNLKKSGSSGGRSTIHSSSANKGSKSGAAILIFIFIAIGIAALIMSSIEPEPSYEDEDIQVTFDEQVSNYEYAVDTLPETGKEVVLNITQGDYLGGVDIPCGTYIVDKDGEYGSLEITDHNNSVYVYVSLGGFDEESTETIENVRIYPTTKLVIRGDISLTLISPNSQPYNINKVPLNGGEEVTTLHSDFNQRLEPGVFNLAIADYESYGTLTLTRADGNVEYYDLDSYSDYQSTYSNLIITSNCTIEVDADFVLTKSTVYDGYTPDEIYDRYNSY